MTLAELIAETRSIINETSSSDSHFTDLQLTTWLNEGQGWAAERLGAFPEQTRDISPSVSAISYPGVLIAQIAAFFYHPTNLKWYQLTMCSTQDMVKIQPDYLNTPAGQPERLIRTGGLTFQLWPVPDTTFLTGVVRIIGLESPTPLSSVGDVSVLPLPAHKYLPHYAAFRCYQQLNRNESAQQEIAFVSSELKNLKSLITNTGGLHDLNFSNREFDT